jgi:hypothetical protein
MHLGSSRLWLKDMFHLYSVSWWSSERGVQGSRTQILPFLALCLFARHPSDGELVDTVSTINVKMRRLVTPCKHSALASNTYHVQILSNYCTHVRPGPQTRTRSFFGRQRLHPRKRVGCTGNQEASPATITVDELLRGARGLRICVHDRFRD